LTVIVLRNRDDRLVLYTGSGQGYLLPSERWVPFLRTLQYTNTFTVATAFALLRPASGWEFVGAAVLGGVAALAIELFVLNLLKRSEDTLSCKDVRDEALAQQSTVLLLGCLWLTGLASAAMFVVALAVRDAPAQVTPLAVVCGLLWLMFVQQLRRKRRLAGP
jgi:hypothetical protein